MISKTFIQIKILILYISHRTIFMFATLPSILPKWYHPISLLYSTISWQKTVHVHLSMYHNPWSIPNHNSHFPVLSWSPNFMPNQNSKSPISYFDECRITFHNHQFHKPHAMPFHRSQSISIPNHNLQSPVLSRYPYSMPYHNSQSHIYYLEQWRIKFHNPQFHNDMTFQTTDHSPPYIF